jgi:hypothetical protein
MLLNENSVNAVRDCVTRGVDDLGQSGLTDGHGRGGVDGRSGNRIGVSRKGKRHSRGKKMEQLRSQRLLGA